MKHEIQAAIEAETSGLSTAEALDHARRAAEEFRRRDVLKDEVATSSLRRFLEVLAHGEAMRPEAPLGDAAHARDLKPE